MTDWGPATEVEAAMRDALNASDQELYFQLLSRCDLLLPVSTEALAGRAPMGWGTWTTGSRTHVLAFTSPDTLFACLNEPGGSYRVVPFHRLAAEWPNYEWWLAVNPGLPIEAYLPSWFVSQLTRGEVRLPGRTMGARARMAQGDLAAALQGRVRAVGPTPPVSAPIPTHVAPAVHPSTVVETVDAEIVDYPPVSASARVYQAAPAVTPTRPDPSRYDPPRTDPPRADSPHYDVPRTDPRFEQPRVEQPRFDQPRFDQPRFEQPRSEPSRYDQPRYEPPRADQPRYDETRYDEPRFEPPHAEDPWTGQSRYEQAPAHPASRYESLREQPQNPYEQNPYEQNPYEASRYGALREAPRYQPGGTLDAEPVYADPVQPVETGRFGTPATSYAPPTPPSSPPATDYAAHTYTVYEADEPIFVDPDATSRITPPPTKGRDLHDAVIVPAPGTWASDFNPANETEASLLVAAADNNTDAFLSTLLLARVIVPVPLGTPSGSRPRDPSFPWQIETGDDGHRFIAVFTSPERLDERPLSRSGSSLSMRFVQLIGAWPDEQIAFAINPGSPVGAVLPGSEIIALASWATEVGLRDEPAGDMVVAAKKVESTPVMGVAGAPANGADRATVMQRTVPHAQVPFYLERGYDRVSGFVNRASEVKHLVSPRMLYKALGLVFVGSPFADDDVDVHVVRWVAHRSDLYRLPYGGQHEAGMRAMQGWVIERSPFRGNGFAPGETDVVSEFKVDSVRLPHGAQMWRLAKDHTETLVASFDADTARWVTGPLAGGARA
jgi:hypothetical protein